MTINYFLKNNDKAKDMHPNWCSGFTLVETLVAISILLISVVSPISLIGDALHKLYYAKDEMIAINLAQEGVEAVRWMRDSNMLAITSGSGITWDSGFDGTNYVVDVGSTPPLTVCNLGCDQKVYFDTATGLYRQTVIDKDTQFSRLVTLEAASLPPSEHKVTSTVTWKTGGTTGVVSATEYLFKWALP